MYQDSFKKKIWEGPIPSLALDLTSVPASMRPLAPAVAAMLSAIVRHTPVDIEEADRDNDGDWFRLESEDLWDDEIFNRLRDNWDAIGGTAPGFALIHFLTGPDAGVWLYHAKLGQLPAYSRGCHRLVS